jgi:hypothetical protein
MHLDGSMIAARFWPHHACVKRRLTLGASQPSTIAGAISGVFWATWRGVSALRGQKR